MSRGGKEILLVDLATHFSGLPRDSVEVDLSKDVSPYVGYRANDLYGFLGRVQLQRDPGSQAEYSNIGMALLGHALALRAGMTFEDLLRRRLVEPLDMTSTAITLTAEQRARQATGHNPKRVPVPPWTGGIMAPTGEAKSTASDMLKFAAAALDPKSPLNASFARMTSVRRPLEDSRTQQALGWAIFRRNRSEMLGHSGATFGFESRLVIDTTRKRAVIAWINGRGEAVTDLVGLAIDRDKIQ